MRIPEEFCSLFSVVIPDCFGVGWEEDIGFNPLPDKISLFVEVFEFLAILYPFLDDKNY